MKKTWGSLVLLASLGLPIGPVMAFGLGDVAGVAAAVANGGSTAPASSTAAGVDAAGLIGLLGQLDVTPKQALGGTGALLGLAQNQLPASEYAALTSAVPGLERLTGTAALGQLSGLGGLLGGFGGQASGSDKVQSALSQVQNLQQARQAFSALGMDPALIGQFAPLLLQYFGNQGVAGPLLQSLASVWGVGGSTGTAR